MLENREIILNLRKERKTYQEIGVLLGVSKQRIEQVCKRLGIKKTPKILKEPISYIEKKRELLLKFHLKDELSGCWNWTRSKAPTGYGATSFLGRRAYTHRVAYHIFKDQSFPVFQDGRNESSSIHICHTCDNPSCINPDHLWAGTPEENMKDRDLKKRDKHSKTIDINY